MKVFFCNERFIFWQLTESHPLDAVIITPHVACSPIQNCQITHHVSDVSCLNFFQKLTGNTKQQLSTVNDRCQCLSTFWAHKNEDDGKANAARIGCVLNENDS